MASEYRHNHYVPVWYQKRFLPPGQADRELQYLDFQPGFFIDGRGVRHEKRAVRRQGFRFCFAQDDLYTVNFKGVDYTQVEQNFFGHVDSNGKTAVGFWGASGAMGTARTTRSTTSFSTCPPRSSGHPRAWAGWRSRCGCGCAPTTRTPS